MRLSDIGEKGVIDMLFKDVPNEDAYRTEDGLAVSVDMLHEETHIPPEASPENIGWFAAAVNLSDLAAAGARPHGMLFALGLPKDYEVDNLKRIYSGIRECLSVYGARLLGGDLKESPALAITGVAIGFGAGMSRKGARAGESVYITGSMGKGVASFFMWAENIDAEKWVEGLMRVEPRVKEGMLLKEHGVRTAMDLSDDINTSLNTLSKINGVGFEIDVDSIPLHPYAEEMLEEGYITLEDVLTFGGDYELLFTSGISEEDFASFGLEVHRIGTVRKEQGVVFRKGSEVMKVNGGYEHFKRGSVLGTR